MSEKRPSDIYWASETEKNTDCTIKSNKCYYYKQNLTTNCVSRIRWNEIPNALRENRTLKQKKSSTRLLKKNYRKKILEFEYMKHSRIYNKGQLSTSEINYDQAYNYFYNKSSNSSSSATYNLQRLCKHANVIKCGISNIFDDTDDPDGDPGSDAKYIAMNLEELPDWYNRFYLYSLDTYVEPIKFKYLEKRGKEDEFEIILMLNFVILRIFVKYDAGATNRHTLVPYNPDFKLTWDNFKLNWKINNDTDIKKLQDDFKVHINLFTFPKYISYKIIDVNESYIKKLLGQSDQ